MNTPDTTLEILTLGRFVLSVDGKPVATDWPDEAVKIFFCSLLSPLDLYFTWDRVCRSTWDTPATRTSKRRLEEILIRPLNSFLTRELGFTPLVSGHDGIRIDLQHIQVDAHEFHSSVVEGLSLLSLGEHAAALEKFSRAETLYAGSYLPGLEGKIINNTRNELESLYRSVIKDAKPFNPQTSFSGYSGYNDRRTNPQRCNWQPSVDTLKR
jgi:hypothetical protein